MPLAAILLFALGLALLIIGAEALVRGAARLALGLGVSPLVTGLTVVAFGTSAPEALVSVHAVFQDQPEIAVGNVVGSNIFNVLLILGLSAVIVPIGVARSIVRFEVPLLIVVSLLIAFIAGDGMIGRLEGLLLLGGLALYIGYTVRGASRDARDHAEPSGVRSHVWRDVGWVLAGLVLLVSGSRLLVGGAVTVVAALGVSPLVIGLTIVAAGTSLPEAATSIVAALRGQRDIAVGNVMGSNLFNLLGILGLSSTVAPHGLRIPPAAVVFDIPIMVATSIVCLPIFFTGLKIARWEGALLLVYYVAYTTFIVLQAAGHEGGRGFGWAMMGVAVPLTVLILGISVLRPVASGWSSRARRRSSDREP